MYYIPIVISTRGEFKLSLDLIEILGWKKGKQYYFFGWHQFMGFYQIRKHKQESSYAQYMTTNLDNISERKAMYKIDDYVSKLDRTDPDLISTIQWAKKNRSADVWLMEIQFIPFFAKWEIHETGNIWQWKEILIIKP